MAIVIKIVSRGDGKPTPHAERYLAHYDPDADPLNGWVESTEFLDEALLFASITEATECWRRVSKTMPRRLSDGRPNRPLSAYTCSFQPVD
jgi:hypothetical protein